MNYLLLCSPLFIYILYHYRYSIILNINYYSKKMIKYVNKSNNIVLLNTINIRCDINNINKQKEWYKYKLDNYIYFTPNQDDLYICYKEYLKFKNKISNRRSPDDIIMAELIDVNGTKNNVLTDIQTLTGPYINKISECNKQDIFCFLKFFSSIKINTSDILEVMYSDGDSETLKFN